MKIILCILFAIILAGCVKEANWNPPQATPALVVVDAILTDGAGQQVVSLTQTVNDPNLNPEAYTGATVLISNEDSSWQLTEDQENPGRYVTPPWFVARLQKNYTLVISKGDQIYSARASMVPVQPFTELRYAMDEEKGLYYIDWVANAFATGDASMWEVMVDWSMVPGYSNPDSTMTHARLLFYTLPTLDVSEIFAPRMESTLFPKGAIITERRYSLTPGHAAFVREMLLETNWTGGLFSVAAANAGTNLSSGAVGYFSVCSVYELSVVVK